MPRRHTPQGNQEVIDFDGAWKEALDLYLEEALHLLAPSIAADIDWTHAPEPLDKELQKATSAKDRKAQTVDKLFRLRLTDGDTTLVLIHIEVQSQTDPTFARRMLRYNTRLFERYEVEVNSLAILGDESADWLPTTFRYGRWSNTQIDYPVVKLLALDRTALDASANPFVMVVLAHLAAQQTRHQPDVRAAMKLDLARRMLEKGFDPAQFDAFYDLIDWLLALPDEDDVTVYDQVKELKEEYTMRHIPIAERYGLKQGKVEGLQAGISVGLDIRFGDAARDVQDAVRALRDVAVLETILDALKTAPSLDAVRALLPQAEA